MQHFQSFKFPAYHISMDLGRGEVVDLIYVLRTSDAGLSIQKELAQQLQSMIDDDTTSVEDEEEDR